MPALSLKALRNNKLDRIAIILSGVCLVHCLAVPVALLLGSVFGDWLIDTESEVHWILLLMAAPVSLWALTAAYLSHGTRSNLIIGCLGLVLMLLGVTHVAGEHLEVAFTVVGVTGVLIAHVRNTLARTHAPH